MFPDSLHSSPPPESAQRRGRHRSGGRLRLDGITQSFGRRRSRKLVFQDLSFECGLNQVAVIYGRNGCGKSTLLRIVARLIAPDAGCVELRAAANGRADGQRALVLHAGNGPGVLHGKLTALENAHYLAEVIDRRIDPALFGSLLDRLGCWSARHERVETLSRGTQQKIVLARALACPVDLLLLDEPTEYLDDAAAFALMDAIDDRSAAGVGFLIATHDERLEQLRDATAYTLADPHRLVVRRAAPRPTGAVAAAELAALASHWERA